MKYENNTINCYTVWKVINEEVKRGKLKITYLSPGGYSFINTEGEEITFDWMDSSGINNDEFHTNLIEFHQINIDPCSLPENTNLEKFDMSFFKDFKKLEEIYCCMDVENVNTGEIKAEVDHNEYVKCVYFEIYDEKTNEDKVLLDELTEEEKK